MVFGSLLHAAEVTPPKQKPKSLITVIISFIINIILALVLKLRRLQIPLSDFGGIYY